MDGENNGKSYEQMDDLGVPPLFFETPIYTYFKALRKQPKTARAFPPFTHTIFYILLQ